MKPDTTTDYDPIPEGLEFDERYMDAAFSMYEAEKKERKRRILIWIWSSSAGMAAVLLLLTLYFANVSGKSSEIPTKTTLTSKDAPVSQKEAANTGENRLLQQTTDAKEADVHKAVKHTSSESRTSDFYVERTISHKTTHTVSTTLPDKLPDNEFTGTEQSVTTNTLTVQHARKSQYGLLKTTLNLTPAVDSTTTLAVLPFNDSSDSAARSLPHWPDLKEQRNHRLYINTGINTLFGMSQLQSGFHLRETVGFNYDYHFAKRFTLSTQLELYALPGISHQQYLGTGESENASISLTKTSLHYLTLAPRLDFHVGERHHVALGTGLEYLIINPGEKYEIREYTGDKNIGNKTAFYESFNRFNYFVSLGYGYDLSKRFSIYGTYHFGLSDMTKNNFNTVSYDRNSRFQLMLRMRIH